MSNSNFNIHIQSSKFKLSGASKFKLQNSDLNLQLVLKISAVRSGLPLLKGEMSLLASPPPLPSPPFEISKFKGFKIRAFMQAYRVGAWAKPLK